jgi:acyl-CoA synthetase (AMP-forming)/AMP-acid ligase II
METVSGVPTEAPRFTIGDLPAKGARLWPGQAALLWDGGSSSRSYAGLDDRVRRLVTLLQEAGVTAGARVGMLARNRPEYFELFFACARLGATMVPVNIRLSPQEIGYQARDSGMSHAILDPDVRDLAEAAGLLGLPHWVLGEAYESALRAAVRAPDTPSRDDSLDVAQMYTSGTTGFAKGCTQTGRGWLQSALNFSQGLRLPPKATVLSPMPYFHAFGFGLSLAHLIVGGTVAVLGGSGADEFWTTLNRCQPQTVVGALALPADPRPVPSVRVVIGPADRDGSRKLLFPHAEFISVYGLTEATNIVMITTEEEQRKRAGTLGRPLPGIDVMVGGVNGGPAAPGEIGELLLRGEQMCSGYWGNEAATRELFAGGWLHTGDLVSQDADGWIYFKDRGKDMIKSGGENVYSAEVERVLAASPLVAEVAVFGVPDDRWTEAVKAVVVLTEDCPEAAAKLDEHSRANIAAYKRPRWYQIVDKLPRNALGKVLKTQLREEHDPATSIRLRERS